MSHSPAAAPPNTETVTREVSLSLLRQQLPLALTSSLVAAVLVFIALSNTPNLRPPLIFWLVSLGVSHGLGLILPRWITKLTDWQWQRRAYLSIYLGTGLLWGLLGLGLLSFGLDIAEILLIVLALLISCSGVLASGVALFSAYLLFLLPALLPLLGIALTLGGRFTMLLAGLLAVFIAVSVLTILGLYRSFRQLLRQEVADTLRLTELSSSQRRLQREVDDYRRVQDELQQQESLHRKLLDAMDCGVYLLEAERFVYANPAWEDFSGYNLEELQQLSLEQLIHPEDWGQLQTLDDNDQKPALDAHQFCRMVRRDGATRLIQLSIRSFTVKQRPLTLGTALPLPQAPAAKAKPRAAPGA